MKSRMDTYEALGTPDDKREQKPVEPIVGLDTAIKKFEKYLTSKNIPWTNNYYTKQFTEVFTPQELDFFLQELASYQNAKTYAPASGAVLTRLIENSYNAGNSSFELNTGSCGSINNLLRNFRTQRKKPLHMEINGNIGTGLGSHAEKVHFTVRGDAGEELGRSSYECSFTVAGTTGDDCGERSTASDFSLQGNVGGYCGENAYASSFDFHKHFGAETGKNSWMCQFTVYSPDRFKRLRLELPKHNPLFRWYTGNMVFLKDSEGTILGRVKK